MYLHESGLLPTVELMRGQAKEMVEHRATGLSEILPPSHQITDPEAALRYEAMLRDESALLSRLASETEVDLVLVGGGSEI